VSIGPKGPVDEALEEVIVGLASLVVELVVVAESAVEELAESGA
jgi:hypothetical protein